MAQINSDIYLQQQAPDLMGSFNRGIEGAQRLSDMAQKKKLMADQQAMKDAYNKNMVEGPDGKMTLDRPKYLSDYAAIDPEGAMRKEQEFAQMDAQKFDMDLRKQKARVDAIASAALASQDQLTYEQQLKELEKRGFDISGLPPQYDQKLVESYAARALTAQEQLANRLKSRDLDLKEREIRAKEKTERVKAPELTEGQKTVDREFAKDYNEWTSGGRDTAQTEINKLQGVINNLQSGKVATGGLTGVFGDRVTSDSVLSARADVNSTVMNSLRAILGAQFTEKEGDRIIKNTWNEADSTANNVARLNRLVGDLQAKAAAKDKKSMFFEQNQSLAGFKGASASQMADQRPQRSGAGSGSFGMSEAKAAAPQQTFKTKQIEWAD